MSFSIWHDYGYGIQTDAIHTDLPRLMQLIGMAPEYEKGIRDFFSECAIVEPTFDDYMELENDEGVHGLAQILREVIVECEDMDFLAIEDCNSVSYLVFSAAYPWSYSEKERGYTEQFIEEVLRRYVSVLTDEAIDIGYQSVENCG